MSLEDSSLALPGGFIEPVLCLCPDARCWALVWILCVLRCPFCGPLHRTCSGVLVFVVVVVVVAVEYLARVGMGARLVVAFYVHF